MTVVLWQLSVKESLKLNKLNTILNKEWQIAIILIWRFIYIFSFTLRYTFHTIIILKKNVY